VLELWDRVSDASQRIGVDQVSVLTTAAQVAELSGESERGAAFAAAALHAPDAEAAPARAALVGYPTTASSWSMAQSRSCSLMTSGGASLMAEPWVSLASTRRSASRSQALRPDT
jgi:hypothetical protein